MRKCLFLAVCMLLSQLTDIRAQQNLFSIPDTVCIRQPVRIIDSLETADSYYWGFCSGFTFNRPIGYNPGIAFLKPPTAYEVVQDNGNYYGFAAVGGFATGPDELYVLHYGSSLSNLPDTVYHHTLNNTMPVNTTKFRFIKTEGNWYAFLCGGVDAINSSIARLDFGQSLGNTPNSVNFGNLDGLLSCPRGIFVENEGPLFYGYVANACDNKLLRLDFGNNISLTPAVTDLGAVFGLDEPSDMAPVQEQDEWYCFITNRGSSTITRLYFGNSLTNIAFPVNIGNMGGRLFGPMGISYIRDCDYQHLFVTNILSNDMARVNMPNILGPYSAVNYTGVGSVNVPMGSSRVIRDKDSIFLYVANWGSNSLTEIIFPQCQNASITSATTKRPPIYSYDTPGTYNVYLAVNEGQANMQVQCKQIVVLPIPPLSFAQDTSICQGDTVTIHAQSIHALRYSWYPNYNITDTGDVMKVQVWPEFTTGYHLVLPYANGCIVDTTINVNVSKIKADAGPDRTISDGAKTMLGGPMTTEEGPYIYRWKPDQFITNTNSTNPVANPPYDFTYYLEVFNTYDGCYDIDTVVVRVSCDDLNLPNAFIPESGNAMNRSFGLMNKKIIKLNYFRIYDRWGQQVFYTTDITKQWNGMINEKPAPMGVYVWEADGFCVEGQHFKRSGNVTLLR